MYTELDSWTDSDGRPWLFFIDGRRETADVDGPVKILMEVNGRMDVVRPWWHDRKTINHNPFFSVLDNLTVRESDSYLHIHQ